MKLNKPIITICLIIILVINLIFFSFLSIGDKTEDKEYVSEIITKFDFKEYLFDNLIIKASIDNLKYPKEVFDYLDDIKIDELKNKIIANLYNSKENFSIKNDVINILDSSIYEFESNRQKDVYSYVQKDINEFAEYIDKKVSGEFTEAFSYIKSIVIVAQPISILLSLILLIAIIWFEKDSGILISSIILLVYSFYVFYLNKFFISFCFKKVLKYFDTIDLKLDNLYIICFILGFVLLLIYIIKLLKKIARDIRIRSYNIR